VRERDSERETVRERQRDRQRVRGRLTKNSFKVLVKPSEYGNDFMALAETIRDSRAGRVPISAGNLLM
jgi:hypothetical protein